jgi:membrane protease YdiL (CAAX protease family)
MTLAPSPPDRRAMLPPFAVWAPFAAFACSYAVAIVITVALLAIVSAGKPLEDAPNGVILFSTLVQDALLVTFTVAFARATSVVLAPGIFGLRRVRLGSALLWALVAFAIFYAFTLGWSALINTHAKDDLAKDLGAEDSTLNLLLIALLVAIVAPLTEELHDRGFLLPPHWPAWGWIPGAIVSGILFGAVHIAATPVVFLLPLAVLGSVLCWLYRHTGSLLPGMGVHAFNNSLALGVTLGWSAPAVLVAIVLAPTLVVTIAARLAQLGSARPWTPATG